MDIPITLSLWEKKTTTASGRRVSKRRKCLLWRLEEVSQHSASAELPRNPLAHDCLPCGMESRSEAGSFGKKWLWRSWSIRTVGILLAFCSHQKSWCNQRNPSCRCWLIFNIVKFVYLEIRRFTKAGSSTQCSF